MNEAQTGCIGTSRFRIRGVRVIEMLLHKTLEGNELLLDFHSPCSFGFQGFL
jgi:hypothetical protein